jgi:hypothetical protein
MASKTTKTILGIGAAAAVWVFVMPLCDAKTVEMAEREGTKKLLKEMAAETNEKAPFMVDEITRLDRVITESRLVNYHYTLMNQDAAEANEMDVAMLGLTVRRHVCANMEGLLDLNVTVRYSYSDPDGDSITDVEVAPSDCPRKAE